LIEFINDLKKTTRNCAKDDVTWFQLDGETKQIEIYRDESIIGLLSENNIIVGKPPASTTETTQPCDRGNLFKASKCRNKSLGDSDVANDVNTLEELKKIFKTHIDKHNGTTIKSKMTSAHVKMATFGLLRIQLALQDTAKPTIIKNSFQQTGVYDVSSGECNIETILNNCTTHIDEPVKQNILNQMNELVHRISVNGELLESDFDELNIEANVEVKGKEKLKDQLVLSRRRAVVLTNMELLNKETNKRNMKISEKAEIKERANKRKAKSLEKKEKKIKSN
jgi:hypothetical protein